MPATPAPVVDITDDPAKATIPAVDAAASPKLAPSTFAFAKKAGALLKMAFLNCCITSSEVVAAVPTNLGIKIRVLLYRLGHCCASQEHTVPINGRESSSGHSVLGLKSHIVESLATKVFGLCPYAATIQDEHVILQLFEASLEHDLAGKFLN
ncbi:MAG: hypothetical protein SGARI_001744, partial [Bacillariaceae sp.]